MLVSDYSYELPDERIAKFPPEERGSTRLLVLDKKTGEVRDSFYRNLDEFLEPGDVIVLNDTKVMKSRLRAELPDGRERELVVLENHGDGSERVMYRGKLHEGDELRVRKGNSRSAEGTDIEGRSLEEVDTKETGLADNDGAGFYKIRVSKILGGGIAEVESETELSKIAEEVGEVPLPPYLTREATEADTKRYQTVWAKNMGSAAAPTASLNMTEELIERLKRKGVIVKYLTLHVGLGTFLPIRTDKVEEHKMHSEWFSVPEDTIEAIQNAKAEGKRVFSVGTTVARTLEFYAKTGLREGEDDIFIYPGFEFRIVDGLLTNFHAPKSTVLMLAGAFAGWKNLERAYQHALDEKYMFLSYGDSMLIF